MIIKKFTGKTEEEATKAARESMGESVVVLNAKPLRKKGLFAVFSKPRIEVTAAIEEESDTPSRPIPPPVSPFPAPPPRFSPEDILPEREETRADEGEKENAIEEKLESIHSLIEQQIKHESAVSVEEEETSSSDSGEMFVFMKLIYNTLIDNEVDEKYANQILDEVEKLGRKRFSMDYMLSSIYERLILKFGQTDLIRKTGDKAQTIFFLGPTGVGKTTTIAKIASRLCVGEKASVALFTTDTYRVKAAEQLRTYADILQIPFRIIYSADDLNTALDEFQDCDYILVDTAGHSPHNTEQLEAQRQFLVKASEKLDVGAYLVLSITTKYRDLLNIAETYSHVVKYKLIFTKLDETSAFGNMLNLRMHTGASLSYVTNGQNVPDDMDEFNAQKIVRILLGGKTPEE